MENKFQSLFVNTDYTSDQLMFACFFFIKVWLCKQSGSLKYIYLVGFFFFFFRFFLEKFGCASRAAALNITNGGDEKENWRPLSATQKYTQRSDFTKSDI